MKIETFARHAREQGHSVHIDRKERYASVTRRIGDNYRLDVYVNFDEDRNIVNSYQHKIIRYDEPNGDSGYAGGMALIALGDLRWAKFNSS